MPAAVRANDLNALELRVMEALTEARVTATVLKLSNAIWRGFGDIGGDPMGIVEMTVEALGLIGLVKYRLPGKKQKVRDPYEGPKDIRLTPLGWAVMGYPNMLSQVNSRMSTSRRIQGSDRTEFRTHDTRATYTEVIRETFAVHRQLFPTHVHDYGDSDMAQERKRVYTHIDREVESEVVIFKTRHPEATYKEIAEALDITERQASYILSDLPRLRRMNNPERADASLKQRIVWALSEMDFATVQDLRNVLGKADDTHNIVHVLHSLHSEGTVDFIEKGPDKTPVRIRLQKRLGSNATEIVVAGPKEVEREVQQEEAVATAKPTITVLPPPEEPEKTPRWPHLEVLRDRERQRIEADQRGLRYIEAAELLRSQDPETARLLDEKASQNDIPFPSPIESEYLRYAQACEDKT